MTTHTADQRETVQAWLRDHDAVSLWTVQLDMGSIGMFHINLKTFLLRFYESPEGEFQGWEVYTNMDPLDHLNGSDTLDKLEAWCNA